MRYKDKEIIQYKLNQYKHFKKNNIHLPHCRRVLEIKNELQEY